MKKRNWFVLFLALFCLMLVPPAQTNAASQKTKALKAYKKFLSQKTIKWRETNGTYYETEKGKNLKFALAYIDKDSVPELVLLNAGSWSHVLCGNGQIYTYKAGKMKFVASLGMYMESKERYYKKKGLVTSYWYDDMDGYTQDIFSVSGGKYKSLLGKYYPHTGKNKVKAYYGENGKKITRKAFLKKQKALIGKKKASKYNWHWNTASNRKKYLK